MEVISTAQMMELLEAKRGASCIGFVALTDPGMNKKSRETGNSNPYYDAGRCCIVKVQRGAAWINARYNAAVEKRVAQEINDELRESGLPLLEGDELREAINERFRKGTNWQQSVVREDGTLTPFCEHKDTHVRYLRTMFLRSVGSAVFIDIRTGDRLTYDDLSEYLPVKKGATNQGLSRENEVRYNAWKVDGIRALNMDGHHYRVRPILEREAEVVFEVLNERLAEIVPPVPEPEAEDAIPVN